jgi:hypothetical protein
LVEKAVRREREGALVWKVLVVKRLKVKEKTKSGISKLRMLTEMTLPSHWPSYHDAVGIAQVPGIAGEEWIL